MDAGMLLLSGSYKGMCTNILYVLCVILYMGLQTKIMFNWLEYKLDISVWNYFYARCVYY